MTETSSIYVACPGCAATTLIQHTGPTVRCAGCGFDYVTFAKDTPAYEAFLVARMREGLGGQLGAIAVHQWASGLGAADAARTFRELGARHGIALPDPAEGDVVLRRALLGVGALVAVIVAFVAYVMATG